MGAAGNLPCSYSTDPSHWPPKPSDDCTLLLRTPSPAIGTATPGSLPATVPLPLPDPTNRLSSSHGSSAPPPGSSSFPRGFLGCLLALPSQNSSGHSWMVPEPSVSVASRWPTGALGRGSGSTLRARTTPRGEVSPEIYACFLHSPRLEKPLVRFDVFVACGVLALLRGRTRHLFPFVGEDLVGVFAELPPFGFHVVFGPSRVAVFVWCEGDGREMPRCFVQFSSAVARTRCSAPFLVVSFLSAGSAAPVCLVCAAGTPVCRLVPSVQAHQQLVQQHVSFDQRLRRRHRDPTRLSSLSLSPSPSLSNSLPLPLSLSLSPSL